MTGQAGGAGERGASLREVVLARIGKALALARIGETADSAATQELPAGAAGGGRGTAASTAPLPLAARTGVPADSAAPAARLARKPGHRTVSDLPAASLLELFASRVCDYKASVRRCPPGGLGAAITAALAGRGARRVVIPPGLLLPGTLPGVELVIDDGLSPEQLDRFDGVITGAAVAIAETGTIVLDGGPGQGRRAISLIPDYHLCIVHADQIVGLVPEAIARLAPHANRPLTWISGPSATSDIELERVEGVHGPRTLEVILVEPAQRASQQNDEADSQAGPGSGAPSRSTATWISP